MMRFGLLQSFDVDGRLDADAFARGVEWGIVWQQASRPGAFAADVHADNLPRIEAMLSAQGRRFTSSSRDGWATVKVAGLD